jgi:hypothetical protein
MVESAQFVTLDSRRRTVSTFTRSYEGRLSTISFGAPYVRLKTWMTEERWVILGAIVLSVAFFIWYDLHGFTTSFNDARLRAMIGRRVVVSRTPGIAQLGKTWLPLNSVLMMPLIWNDLLFRSGIAASLPSMLAYVVGCLYMFKIGRLITSSSGGGWVAYGAFALNPSLLYMQSTAMSETASISALVIATYYLLRLIRTRHALDVAKCAAAASLGTLARYENWVIAIAFVPVIAYAGWRYRGFVLAEAWTILYGLLAFVGCALWILYNAVIFHDPLLSFFYGQSSHSYYANTPDAQLPARHHAGVALKMYGVTVVGTVGWVLTAMALVGLGVFIWRNRVRLPAVPVYLTLVPFAFYWFVLYRGVNTENLPELGMGRYYNIRFGLMMIPAVALLVAVLSTAAPGFLKGTAVGITLAVVVATSVLGFATTPFVLREALHGAGSELQHDGEIDARWFSSQYHGGAILITYVNDQSMIFYLLTQEHVHDRALITDTNEAQFTAALQDPAKWVTWIVMSSDASNGQSAIWTALHQHWGWLRYFALRRTLGTTQVFERLEPGTSARLFAAPSN